MEKINGLDLLIMTAILVASFLVFIVVTFRELNTMSKTSYKDLNALRENKIKPKKKEK